MFLYPRVLWALLLFIPLILFQYRSYFRGRREILPLYRSSPGRENLFFLKVFLRDLCFDIGLLCLILAVSGVSWGADYAPEEREGVDAVFVVDVSRSMLSGDLEPSRLGRVKTLLHGLVETSSGVRFGLVAFKGDAVKIVSPTEDSEALISAVDRLSPGMITTPGTDIAAAIETGASMFFDSSDRFRHLFLFTDGEALSGDTLSLVPMLADRSIQVYPIASGTPEGASIRLSDGSFVIDSQGDRVVSKMNLEVLEALSRDSDGVLFRLDDPMVLSKLRREIQGHIELAGQNQFVETRKDQYLFFLAVGFIFFIFSVLIRSWRWRGDF